MPLNLLDNKNTFDSKFVQLFHSFSFCRFHLCTLEAFSSCEQSEEEEEATPHAAAEVQYEVPKKI